MNIFFFCILSVAEYFRARIRQYSIDKNMMAIGHLLKRECNDVYVIINAYFFKGKWQGLKKNLRTKEFWMFATLYI